MTNLVDEQPSPPIPAHDKDLIGIEPVPVETDGDARLDASAGALGAGGERAPAPEDGSGVDQEAVTQDDAGAPGAEGAGGQVAELPAAAAGGDPAPAGVGDVEKPPAADAGGEAAAPDLVVEGVLIVHDTAQTEAEEKKRRRRLLVCLALLLVALGGTITMIYRYVTRPAPLPDLLPVRVEVSYAPHYLFSIYGVDEPVGVALSPKGDRIYVAETGGERQVKIFDRDGNLLGSLAPPRTGQSGRSPVYLATDPAGRVYVADRLQHALFVYDGDGSYLDTILGPDLTLSEHVAVYAEAVGAGATFAYDALDTAVYYRPAGEVERSLPAPNPPAWSPLGVRIDDGGTMLVTDVGIGRHCVHVIPDDVVLAAAWDHFDPPGSVFGVEGQGNGQFLFPNVAVADSRGQIYVTDGNNGRISVWNDRNEFLYDFGRGAGESALNLPRGADIDARDRLHVVDAVGQTVRVYDVSDPEPRFLFAFGNWGLGDGQFNYPNDIALDSAGRLYVADRENNRVQVWSY